MSYHSPPPLGPLPDKEPHIEGKGCHRSSSSELSCLCYTHPTQSRHSNLHQLIKIYCMFVFQKDIQKNLICPVLFVFQQYARHLNFWGPLMEYDLWRKTTFNGRQSLMEDNLWRKTTFDRRRPLTEDDLWKGVQYITWKKCLRILTLTVTAQLTKPGILSAV